MSIFGSLGIGGGRATNIDGMKGTGNGIGNMNNGLPHAGSKTTMANGVFMMDTGVRCEVQNDYVQPV